MFFTCLEQLQPTQMSAAVKEQTTTKKAKRKKKKVKKENTKCGGEKRAETTERDREARREKTTMGKEHDSLKLSLSTVLAEVVGRRDCPCFFFFFTSLHNLPWPNEVQVVRCTDRCTGSRSAFRTKHGRGQFRRVAVFLSPFLVHAHKRQSRTFSAGSLGCSFIVAFLREFCAK